MEIGDKIKQRRLQLNLSQEELAKKVGYKSRSSINKIEIDGRGLPQSKIKALAEALKTTPAYLMGWDDEQRFPVNLRKLMQSKNINVNALSTETGINTKRIIQFLDCKDDPTKDEAEQLADYFDIKFTELLTGEIIVCPTTDLREKEIIDLIGILNDTGKDKVIAYIKDLSDKYFNK